MGPSIADQFVEFVENLSGSVPEVVLLDIGGVLTPDPWQTLLLTPDHGVAVQLGIDHAALEAAATQLWPEFSLHQRSERDWWLALGRLVGQAIPQQAIRQVEAEYLRPFAGARALIRAAGLVGEVGVISDNTAFWYAKQRRWLDLSARTRGSLRFLSFERGLAKSSLPFGLFELAARELGRRCVVVVDDREDNCERARAVGFKAVRVRSFHGLEPNG